VIRSFGDDATRDIYDGTNSKKARKKLNARLYASARRKLDMLDVAITLEDLNIPPSNRLESLRGSLGKHSIRVNDQYRIVFHWTDDDAEEVTITDYH